MIYPNKCIFCQKALDDKNAHDCCHGGKAPYPYGDATRGPVHRLKYGGVRTLAVPMAKAMVRGISSWKQPPYGAIPLIVPVPLHSEREKERGFNQAKLLALEIYKLTKFPMMDGLTRPRNTAPQHGLTPDERAANLEGAIAVKPDFDPANRHILLVDDIYTTGATSAACIAALTTAGAISIEVIVFAKV